MLKRDKCVQQNLFGISTELKIPKIIKKPISIEQRAKNIEKSNAHRVWKLYKSRKFDANLTYNDKYLLQKYYGVELS